MTIFEKSVFVVFVLQSSFFVILVIQNCMVRLSPDWTIFTELKPLIIKLIHGSFFFRGDFWVT